MQQMKLVPSVYLYISHRSFTLLSSNFFAPSLSVGTAAEQRSERARERERERERRNEILSKFMSCRKNTRESLYAATAPNLFYSHTQAGRREFTARTRFYDFILIRFYEN